MSEEYAFIIIFIVDEDISIEMQFIIIPCRYQGQEILDDEGEGQSIIIIGHGLRKHVRSEQWTFIDSPIGYLGMVQQIRVQVDQPGEGLHIANVPCMQGQITDTPHQIPK